VVCRIAGRPGPDTEPCNNTPPATAYWSYWFASRGGEWCYSTVGAANRTPPTGSVEGWSFFKGGGGDEASPPGYAPPPPSPGEPQPEPVSNADCRPRSTPTTAAPAPSPPPPAGAAVLNRPPSTTTPGGGGRPATTSTASLVPGATTTVPEAIQLAGDPTTTTGPVGINQVNLSEDGGGDGNPVALLTTVGLLGALGAGGLVLRRLRR
jgi:hypothetical protein